MKKQLIAIGLVSFLAVPSAVFAEGDACAPIMSEGMTEEAVMAAKSAAMDTSECMGQRLGSIEEFSHGHGVSLYGSFRTGLVISGGETNVSSLSSRWGFQGSAEVSEGLTAAFRYEAAINTANAQTLGGVGHGHEAVDDTVVILSDAIQPTTQAFNTGDTTETTRYACTAGNGNPLRVMTDDLTDDDTDNPTITGYTEIGAEQDFDEALTDDVVCGYIVAGSDAIDADSDPGGRLSYVDLSGGFGSIRLGQIWSASANHYYFKIDPSHVNGKGGGSSFRNANSISYSSSAGDVSFQIDKVTGDDERVEFGATAALGPVGVGVGHWKSGVDERSFTGVALSAGAGGLNLTVGLGNSDDADGDNSNTSILHLAGSVGDSGVSYGIQIANSDDDTGDQNLVALTNSLGSGASLIFEFSDPGGTADSTSIIGLRVDF